MLATLCHLPTHPPDPTHLLAEGGQDGGSAAGGAAGAGSMQQRLSDYVLPACDSKALCAYLSLFK